MKRVTTILVCFYSILTPCFAQKSIHLTKQYSLSDSLTRVPDSIKVGDITIHNLYKSQILSHKANGEYDSVLIVRNVYRPQQQLWDSCYAMIFGANNASKFNTPSGMIAWNRTLYPQNKMLFDQKARLLLSMHVDSIFGVNLKRFNQLVNYKSKAVISLLFTPIQGIGFGGCNAGQFALELNYENNDLAYTINKGIPHELNHLAYEPQKTKDPKTGTALAQTIDEGFACYFTWVFFDRKLPKYQVVENMSTTDWNWYLAHEKELFQKLSQYFENKTGDNPLLRNDKYKLFPGAPKTLFYWMGFRIVETYVNKHGTNSWKNIYNLPVQEVLNQSGYANYIDRKF